MHFSQLPPAGLEETEPQTRLEVLWTYISILRLSCCIARHAIPVGMTSSARCNQCVTVRPTNSHRRGPTRTRFPHRHTSASRSIFVAMPATTHVKEPWRLAFLFDKEMWGQHALLHPLSHCAIVPLSHCAIVPLFHCPMVALFRCGSPFE